MLYFCIINTTDVNGFRMSRMTRSQLGRHSLSPSRAVGGSFEVGCELEKLVVQAISQGPYLVESDDNVIIAVDKQVRWTCDNIVQIDGRENYRALPRQWTETALPELSESR